MDTEERALEYYDRGFSCERFRGEYGRLTCRELRELVGDKSRCREFIAYGAQLVSELTEENL